MSVLNLIAIYFATRYVGHTELLVFVVLASMCWQIQEVLRTVFLSRLQYDLLIPGDAISYLGQAAVVGCICLYRVPGLSSVFLVVIASSLVAAVLQAIQIRPATVNCEWLRLFRC